MKSEPAPPERLIRAERAIIPVRIAVIAFNSFAYSFLLDQRGTIRWLAYSIIAVSCVYAVAVVFLHPYQRFQRLWSWYWTSIFDGMLTIVWIHATGGFGSPFYLLFYLTVTSVAVRFDVRYTMISATLYAGGYLMLLAGRGELNGSGRLVAVAVRVTYIYLCAALAGLLAREAIAEASGRRAVRRLVAVTSSIAHQLDSDVVLARLGAAAKELTGAHRVAIYLFDRKGGCSCAYRDRLSAAYVDAFAQRCRALDVSLQQVADAATHPALAGLHEAIAREGFHTFALLPLVVLGQKNGLLTLHRDRVSPFSDGELDLARALADQAAVTIENARLVTDLRDEAARVRTILDAAPGGIIYYANGRVLANPHAEALFGRVSAVSAPEGFEGQLLDVNGTPLPPEEMPLVRALAGQTCSGEERIARHPSGRQVPILVNAAPIFGDDAVIGAVATYQDISAIKDLERVRDEYIALVSHDLRSPMTAIRLHAEMLRDVLTQADLAREALSADAIVRNTGRVTRLIQDLVDSTQLEVGRMPMERVPTNLGELLARIVEQLPAQHAERILLELPSDERTLVLADGAGLERVVMNLMNNAIKYTPPRSPIIVRLAHLGEVAVVSVIDRGPGIQPEDQPRIFEKYFRSATHSKAEGLGLGLYICRLIVDANGGRIWVESQPGGGAAFRFAIPLLSPAAKQTTPASR